MGSMIGALFLAGLAAWLWMNRTPPPDALADGYTGDTGEGGAYDPNAGGGYDAAGSGDLAAELAAAEARAREAEARARVAEANAQAGLRALSPGALRWTFGRPNPKAEAQARGKGSEGVTVRGSGEDVRLVNTAGGGRK